MITGKLCQIYSIFTLNKAFNRVSSAIISAVSWSYVKTVLYPLIIALVSINTLKGHVASFVQQETVVSTQALRLQNTASAWVPSLLVYIQNTLLSWPVDRDTKLFKVVRVVSHFIFLKLNCNANHRPICMGAVYKNGEGGLLYVQIDYQQWITESNVINAFHNNSPNI